MVDEPEGVSTRQLLAAFFAVVVLCAVFFSLGFFLGRKEPPPENSLAVEQVPATSSDVPQTVNPPAQPAPADASAGPSTAASNPSAAAGSPLSDTAQASAAEATPADTPASDNALGKPPLNAQSAPPATAQPAALRTPAAAPAGKLPRGSLIQVAALTNQQDANDMVGVLQSRGYPALILTPQQARAHDNLFRVVAGPYATRAAAETARSQLAAAGFKPFIRP